VLARHTSMRASSTISPTQNPDHPPDAPFIAHEWGHKILSSPQSCANQAIVLNQQEIKFLAKPVNSFGPFRTIKE
jgi:hypothetical protein